MAVRSKAFQAAINARLDKLSDDPRFKGLGVVACKPIQGPPALEQTAPES